jgi:hypothetical protein
MGSIQNEPKTFTDVFEEVLRTGSVFAYTGRGRMPPPSAESLYSLREAAYADFRSRQQPLGSRCFAAFCRIWVRISLRIAVVPAGARGRAPGPIRKFRSRARMAAIITGSIAAFSHAARGLSIRLLVLADFTATAPLISVLVKQWK